MKRLIDTMSAGAIADALQEHVSDLPSRLKVLCRPVDQAGADRVEAFYLEHVVNHSTIVEIAQKNGISESHALELVNKGREVRYARL